MKRLIILDAGGYGQTIADVATQSGEYGPVCFLDDHSIRQDVVGTCSDYAQFITENTVFYPAFGSNAMRLAWVERLLAGEADVLHAGISNGLCQSQSIHRNGKRADPQGNCDDRYSGRPRRDCQLRRHCRPWVQH